MKGLFLSMLVCVLLAGCGLGETAVSTAAAGASQAEQAQQATRTEARVREQLDAAAKADAERRNAAENASQ
jgi:uncharacterized protein YceK